MATLTSTNLAEIHAPVKFVTMFTVLHQHILNHSNKVYPFAIQLSRVHDNFSPSYLHVLEAFEEEDKVMGLTVHVVLRYSGEVVVL